MSIDQNRAHVGSRALRISAMASTVCAALLTACAPGGGAGGAPANDPNEVNPPEALVIGPENDFDPEVLQRVYTLPNPGAAPLQWSAYVTQPWLSITSSASGELAPGQTVEVVVEVDAFEAGLTEVSPAVGQVVFMDQTSSTAIAEREVSVDSIFGQSGLAESSATPSVSGGTENLTGSSSGGWTTFTASANTRMVYVSDSQGNDQNNGLSPAYPKRTIAAGKALMRQGYPDWLLLMRGDVWQESLGQWKVSGPSSSEPMLVSSYGDASERPLLETGQEAGVWTEASTGSAASIDNLAIVGLHFYANEFEGWGNCVGARMLLPSSNVLIEDCKIEGYSTNVVFQGFGGLHKNFQLRRSVIVDAYSVHGSGNHSQGLYAYAVNGLLLEDNVFDHNGWNENVPGAGADIFNHNIYIDNGNYNVTVRGNIITNAASHGMQLRSGGLVMNNLFVRNSIALHLGGGNNPEQGGVTADVLGNMILDGKNIDDANPRGWGLWMANIASGRVAYNVIANNELGDSPVALALDATHHGDNHPSIGVHELNVQRNIFYNWGGGTLINGNNSQLTDLTLYKNDFQDTLTAYKLVSHEDSSSTSSVHSSGNLFYSQYVPSSAWTQVGPSAQALETWKSMVNDQGSQAVKGIYPDPTRSPATYNGKLGGYYTFEDFIAKTRMQSKSNWQMAYMAVSVNRYMRIGFRAPNLPGG
jgi:hypothetical protein